MPYISKIKIGEQSYDIKDKLFRDYLDEIENNDKKNQPIRILGIGNSIFRDSIPYLYEILENAGYTDVVIGHLYQGATNLKYIYGRFIDKEYEPHKENNVPLTLEDQEYWKYSNENKITPNKYNKNNPIPNAIYSNGVHLKDILRDEQWNIIIFQEKLDKVDSFEHFYNRANTNKYPNDYDYLFKEFKIEIENYLNEIYENNNIKFGLQVSWTNTNETTEKYKKVQEVAYRVARWCNLDFIINSGKAIEIIRENPYFYNPCEQLSGEFQFTFDDNDNKVFFVEDALIDKTHPLPGIVTFLLSYQFAYTLFGIMPEDITIYPNDITTMRDYNNKNEVELKNVNGSYSNLAETLLSYIKDNNCGVLAQQAKQYAILASQP